MQAQTIQALQALADPQYEVLARLRYRDLTLPAVSKPTTVLAINDAWNDAKILKDGAPIMYDPEPGSPWSEFEAFIKTLRDAEYIDSLYVTTGLLEAVDANWLSAPETISNS